MDRCLFSLCDYEFGGTHTGLDSVVCKGICDGLGLNATRVMMP